jgi:hypothetical protein
MKGERNRRRLHEEVEKRFYPLGQFLGGHLHQDWPKLHGTPEQAVGKAIEEYPVELRQELRRKMAALLMELTDDWQLRDALNRALGVNVHFKTPAAARAFALDVEARLIASLN